MTFALWFGLVLSGFLAVGVCFGWVLQYLLPPHQERLPRRLWVVTCLGASLVFGALAGLHVGEATGLLAFGDSLATGGRWVVITHVLPPDRSLPAVRSIRRLGTALHEEAEALMRDGAPQYVVGHVVLSGLCEPIVTAAILGRAYLQTGRGPIFSSRTFRVTWDRARPALERQAVRKVGMSIMLSSMYFLALIAAGLLVILIAWREVRRHPYTPDSPALARHRPQHRTPSVSPLGPPSVSRHPPSRSP